MAEDEIVGAGVLRALEVLFERGGDTLGHRDRSAGALRLRSAEAPAGVVAADADQTRLPVDVFPAQGDQLALAQAGHGGGQVERLLDRAENVVGYLTQERLEFL